MDPREETSARLDALASYGTCGLYFAGAAASLLSAFATVYKFQQALYNEPAFLLASYRTELKPFVGAVPLLEIHWSLVLVK